MEQYQKMAEYLIVFIFIEIFSNYCLLMTNYVTRFLTSIEKAIINGMEKNEITVIDDANNIEPLDHQ